MNNFCHLLYLNHTIVLLDNRALGNQNCLALVMKKITCDLQHLVIFQHLGVEQHYIDDTAYFLVILSKKQCAAVKICFLDINVPPQRLMLSVSTFP